MADAQPQNDEHILGLSLDTLHKLYGGRILQQLQSHIDAMEQDLINRPGEKGKRQITLVLEATPKTREIDMGPSNTKRLETYGANVSVYLASKRPKHKAEDFDFRLDGTGRLVFNERDSRDFNAQPLLPCMNEDEEPSVKMPGA